MNKYLENLGYDFWEKSILLTDGLNLLLKCKVLNGKDLTILNSGGRSIPEIEIADANKKSDFEYLENNTRIDDYVAHRTNFIDSYFLELGLEFLKQLTRRLQDEFSGTQFRLILSFGKTEDPDIYECGNCNVSFYKIRNGAEETYRISDLNDFKAEGLIEIEINN